MISSPRFQRDYTAERLNAVVNRPDVFPFIAMAGQVPPLDFSPITNDLNHVALMTDDGGIVALCAEPGIYEIHTQFTSELRGAAAIKLVRDMVSELFLSYPCVELLTKIPVTNPAALGLVRAIGGRYQYSRTGAWPALDGDLVDVDYYALRWDDWLWTEWAMKSNQAAGQEFHEALTRQKAELGLGDEPHPEDLAHDVVVGATSTMISRGQLDKGVVMYNRWARFAGYAPIALISRSPTVININDCWLELCGEGFRIVRAFQPSRQEVVAEPERPATAPKLAIVPKEPTPAPMSVAESVPTPGSIEELRAKAKAMPRKAAAVMGPPVERVDLTQQASGGE